jgi:hypothetical protein
MVSLTGVDTLVLASAVLSRCAQSRVDRRAAARAPRKPFSQLLTMH